jgi:NAD(P)H-hydrate repair Nnr-like enzyme with NAD(P)H-hydrate epimerase domain
VPPKPLSVAEARAIDQHASQVLGMPSNNGGDALVAARGACDCNRCLRWPIAERSSAIVAGGG